MTALKQTKSDNATPIEAIQQILASDMATTNALILARMSSDTPLIPQLAGYLIAAGGKRIRPLLTLAAAHICGHTKNAHGLAAAVEFIHTATLLHDDVIDESTQRRGKPAANLVFGNKETVLVGDFLFARAFELMVECDDIRILDILARASRIISEGEVLQMSLTGNLDISQDDYFQIIEAKTAALFSAAMHAGALSANAPDATAQHLRAYGHHLGMAFQIIDDVIDYTPTPHSGKNIGDDFGEGKITLPTLFAIQSATKTEREFWHRTMHNHTQTDGDLNTALSLVEKYDTLSKTRAAAQHHTTLARQSLSHLPQTDLTFKLDELLDFVLNRNH